MALHQGGQRGEQLGAVGNDQRDRNRIKSVVIVVFFRVVVGFAGVDHVFHRALQSQQHVHGHLTMRCAHQLHTSGGFCTDGGLDGFQRSGIHAIHLVHDDQVGGGQLVFKQLSQGGVMVQVVVGTALGVDGHRVVSKGACGHSGRVHHGDDRVHSKRVAQRGPLKGLHQRLGQGQTGGFNHQIVDLVAPGGQLLHHRGKFFLHGAAQAAIGQLEQLAVFDTVFIAANAAAAQQFAVDAQFAKLVDDDRDAAALGVGEQVAQQGCFTATQEAGNDGGGDFSGLHKGCISKNS